MSALKCVVEGCNLEYDVICSFSFYNVNTGSENENQRQEWIEGAMQEEKECLWRHFSLQLCGYHFELDAQGLWIDSPMLPELLTLQEPPPLIQPSEEDKRLADIIRMDHNYIGEPVKKEAKDTVSRLNVRQLVDTLGYLSLKNLQKKQLWVVKVETDKAEASITQSEQVITKMQDPKQIIEIIPQSSTSEPQPQAEVLHIMEDGQIGDNFIYEIAEEQEIATQEVEEAPAAAAEAAEWMLDISADAGQPKYAYIKQCADGQPGESFMYEIAEEQEIAMEDVKEITTTETSDATEWTVNITPETPKHKYAYIKHCNTGKKKRHFTADMNEITLHGDFENYYILPDVDPSVGVEITTSYEPENFIVEEYQHLVLEDRPRKRARDPNEPGKRKKKKVAPPTVRDQVKQIQIKNEIGEDWVIDNSVVYEEAEEYDDKKAARVRRKNKKYLGYDFVT